MKRTLEQLAEYLSATSQPEVQQWLSQFRSFCGVYVVPTVEGDAYVFIPFGGFRYVYEV